MPEPVGRSQRYMPGLDGVRALAVAAVIGYHLGVSWLPGGLLGVGIFFTLSGYLITDLLLMSWESTGGLALRSFWARRARRLLPALFVMLVVVSTWAAVAQPSQLAALRGQVLAATLYVSNWWAAFQHVSYFARFGPPSPLGHLWSLAIEEQFYLVWPWLLLLGLVWLRRRRQRLARDGWERRWRLRAPTLAAGGAKPLPTLEFALAGGPQADSVMATMAGGHGGAGLRLLGPYIDRGGGPQREEGQEGAAETLGRAPAGEAEETSSGPDLLALGKLYAGRAPGVAFAPPSEPLPQRLYSALGVPSRREWLWPLAVVVLVLALASALEMALMYRPSFDPSRIYDGTDTRASGLLVGAALAMAWPSSGMRREVNANARRVLDFIGLGGLVLAAVLICTTGQYSAWLYRGGMTVLSLAAAAVVAAAAHPATLVGRVLGMRPLRWLGVRSYGVYLWHYPVIVLTAPSASAGFDLPRAVLQVGATLVLAELSWRFVESPVRHGALGRAWRELSKLLSDGHFSRVAGLAEVDKWARAPSAGANSSRRRWRLLPLGGVPAGVIVASLALAGVLQPPSGVTTNIAAGNGPGGADTTTPVTTTPVTTAPARSSRGLVHVGARRLGPPTSAGAPGVLQPGHHRVLGHQTTPETKPKTGAGPLPHAAAPPRTSCKEVVHMGDSTSDSLVSPNYLPDPAQRLGADYARVGVERSIMRIEGGTSIVETLPGTENAYEMAQALIRQGYRGCWVLALGTNDAADVYVGSNVGLAQRVEEMMSLIGNRPVLWVNVKTLVASGPYAEANMLRWDRALTDLCSRYPDMAVFDWAALVQPSWFIADGIHYSSEGSAKRAAAIADALASAFPAGGPVGRRAGACLVNAAPSWHLPNFQY